MRLSKRILNNTVVLAVVSWLAAGYIRFVYATSRWQVVRGEIPGAFWDANKPFILCFWHGRLLLMPYIWQPGRMIHTLISMHRDGVLLNKIVSHFDVGTVEGSTSRGGAAALKRLLGALKAGDCVGITPDGPRGPRMRASGGIVAMARLSGAPVIPVSYSIAHRHVLRSWDRFLVAWPFSRGVFVWGDPIEVPRDIDDRMQEEYRQRIEDAMNEVSREADRLVGQTVIEPAPVESVSHAADDGDLP